MYRGHVEPTKETKEETTVQAQKRQDSEVEAIFMQCMFRSLPLNILYLQHFLRCCGKILIYCMLQHSVPSNLEVKYCASDIIVGDLLLLLHVVDVPYL